MLRTPTRGLLVALLALPWIPSNAQAQVHDFGVRCVAGSFRACASVQAWNEVDATTGEHSLFVQIANVQGRAGFLDYVRSGLGWFMINDLTLFNYTTSPYWNSGNQVQDVQSRFYDMNYHPIGDPFLWHNTGGRWDVGSTPYSDSEHLIWGCYVPGAGDANFQWGGASTCSSSLTYRMTLGFGAGFALSSSSTVGLAFDTYDDGGVLSTETCGISQDGSATPCATVTPEPITMVLLGSGLFGVGGAALRRRRRENGLPEADA